MKRTAYCKINLTLEILGTRRGDGFHDLKSVMHKIPLGDSIELEVSEGAGKISLLCDSNVCAPEENLAYKAAEKYLVKYTEKTEKKADVRIKLQKITPTGAGLGGGSADAATVLDMLEESLGGLNSCETLELAKELGSDVPFCLGRYMSAVCTGRGEICREISRLPYGLRLVVAKPVESINTKGIYGEYDKKYGDDYSKSVTDEMEKALENSEINEISKHLVNDFEKVCIPRLPEIESIKHTMSMCGALCCQMSGSGSAVFALFDDEKDAAACFDRLKKDGLSDVYVFGDSDFEKMYRGE